MNAFCTIATASHIPKALALHHSLRQFDHAVEMNLLIVDLEHIEFSLPESNLKIYFLNDVADDELSKNIISKYSEQTNELRWSLKSVFLRYLMQKKNYDGLIFLDNDTYFFNDFHFLFDLLKTHNILLNPHWRISSPDVDKDWFETNFKDGLYNGGFVGINKHGISAMEWWAKCCLYACEKNPARGLWDDQRYLDMFPGLFEQVKILEHQGCDVAYWNRRTCLRSLSNGEVVINEKWPVIFIHFTAKFIRSKELDPLLLPHLEQHLQTIEHYRELLQKAEINV